MDNTLKAMIDAPDFETLRSARLGGDPCLDAWVTRFFTENNLEHAIDPDKNASPEQVRFMVALENGQVFAPCSDWMFRELLRRGRSRRLMEHYFRIWKRISGLVREYVREPYARAKIIQLCRLEFKDAISGAMLVPSRLLKRLLTIVLTQSGLDDPWRARKAVMNGRAAAFMQTPEFRAFMSHCPGESLACENLEDLRFDLDMLVIRRLLALSMWPGWPTWTGHGGAAAPDFPDREALRALAAEVREDSSDFARVADILRAAPEGGLKVLYLPCASGEFMFDLLAIRTLLRMGHKVVLALKDGFLFETPTVWDPDSDAALSEALSKAHFVEQPRLTKNELLHIQRERPFVVISDGTREQLNLCRTSVTFARAWKEADLVIAKGELNHRRLIQTSYEFTRDVFCVFRSEAPSNPPNSPSSPAGLGRPHMRFKPRVAGLRVFTEDAILAKAESIVARMRAARAAGRTVMFYSAIVGSIPGQTKVAVQVLTAFVNHLRTRLGDGALVINPAEVFEEGMDGDDLMFMWERVQRSGLIDVWRFQTDADIERAFELLGQTVPPAWAGKDATYSTGCTKEMRIALDEQARRPEMQIIGPAPEKFFRRREYGVGKFCDAGLECNV